MEPDRVDVVDQRHQACDRRVELHRLDVSRHLLDRLVEFHFHIRICRSVSHDVRQACHTLQGKRLQPFTELSFHGAAAP